MKAAPDKTIRICLANNGAEMTNKKAHGKGSGARLRRLGLAQKAVQVRQLIDSLLHDIHLNLLSLHLNRQPETESSQDGQILLLT